MAPWIGQFTTDPGPPFSAASRTARAGLALPWRHVANSSEHPSDKVQQFLQRAEVRDLARLHVLDAADEVSPPHVALSPELDDEGAQR